MFRLISVLLILLGLGAATFGFVQYQASTYPQPDVPPKVAAQPAVRAAPSLDDDDMISIASVAPDIVSTLRTVPIAYETPTKAKFGMSFDVTLAVDSTGDASASDALSGQGTIVESSAQVSSQVLAALSGDSFNIVAATPMTQTMSPLTENVWRWRVTPTQTGQQFLTIDLYALQNGSALPLHTFRDEIEVEVSRVGQVIATIQSVSPIAIFIGGIGSFLAGLLGALRFFRGR